MPRKVTLSLLPVERLSLIRIIDRGNNWRERQRSNTLILLDDGASMREVANIIGIDIRTVGLTRMDWLARGFDSLVDAPRCGAPRKIKQEQLEKLIAAASEEPLTAKSLLAKHVEGGGEVVHVNTIKGALKNAGYVWKRTRGSLKKKRDEDKFRAMQLKVAALREQAARGEIVLAYCDEAGFSAVHPNRSAWTKKGERHLIDAKRGKRLNVMAAMLSTGELFSVKYWKTTTAEIFTGFVGLLKKHVGKKITIIIDNASIHKAKAMQPLMSILEAEGVTLHFLSPYSPELNRIEKLWHLMKYTWMSVKCRDSETLEKDVGEILDNFGEKYKLCF